MKKVVITFLCFTISLVCNICNSQTRTNYNCAEELNSNQILKLESVSFNQTITKEDTALLKKIIEYGIKNYPEMQSWKVDFKLRKADSLIIDIYGFLDKAKINNLVCDIKRNNIIKLPENTILLFHELDSGKAIFGVEMFK